MVVPLEFARERELVHLRYELRRLIADRRRDEALPILQRLREIAAADAEEVPALPPEIERWASSFNL